MTAARNDAFITRTRHMLGQGYGVEDIAHRLGRDIADVRSEVAIYRAEGRIQDICRRWAG